MSRGKEIKKAYVYRPGKTSSLERSKLRAQNLLNKVIPFEAWCATEPRNEFEKEAYWIVVNGLKKIAKEGVLEELKC